MSPQWTGSALSERSFVQIHEGSVRALSILILPTVSSLFLSAASTILLGRYPWTDQWFLCRLFSIDSDGTFSIVWQDGFLQIGTPWKDLRRLSPSLTRRIQQELDETIDASLYGTPLASNQPPMDSIQTGRREPMTINGLDVWEAAKQGNLRTTLAIIDLGGTTPNDVEILDADARSASAQGRSPLYWAYFGGHVELVRELLLRGGVDHDGAAYLAVTTRQVADDHRDIMFDPDTGVFSDFVDYDASQMTQNEKTNADDVLLIRAMLVAAKSAGSTDAGSLGRRLPKQLYHEAGSECVVCLTCEATIVTVPCGHVACCVLCVNKVRKLRDGCPLCRAPILAIECSSISPEPSSGQYQVRESAQLDG
jgi:hypothetical protein